MAVGWYLRFSLSYRDVEELLAERGLHADHVTVWRWVQRYAPEIEQRLRSRLKQTNDSWRVDESYIRVEGNLRLRQLVSRESANPNVTIPAYFHSLRLKPNLTPKPKIPPMKRA